MDARRWVLLLILCVAFVGFVAFARGHAHHRGEDVGRGSIAVVVATPPG
jgi:hypothetical protein